MKEKHIEKAVCNYATELGFLQRKFTSPSTIAVPDRIFWGHGECFLIEFKNTGEKTKPAQKREIRRIRDHGGKVAVIDNIPDGNHLLDCVIHRRLTPLALELFSVI